MSLPQKDDEKAIWKIGRQEVITALLIVVLGIVSFSAIATLFLVYTDPDIRDSLTVTGTVDIGKFVDKAIESYDAFLLLLGVTSGSGGTITAIKLGRSLARC